MMVTKAISVTESLPSGVRLAVISRCSHSSRSEDSDYVAEEAAVALVYNGISYAVMMATPQQLEAFGLGFSISEGLIDSVADLYDISVQHHDTGYEIRMTVASRCETLIKQSRRRMAGRTGCGICGQQALALATPEAYAATASLKPLPNLAALQRAIIKLDENAPLRALTGALHGVAWCDNNGDIKYFCEDIGRHNALDKVIGLVAKQGQNPAQGFVVLSSRASYEMVVKSMRIGFTTVVAVSAATALAIDLARQANINLLGFVRRGQHVVYHGLSNVEESDE